MSTRWIVTIMILLTVLPSSLIQFSKGEPVQITVGQSSITMNMELVLRENLTSLPAINTSLSESNSSTVLQPILQPINSSISRLVPSARITGFQLHAQTVNSSGTWLMEENYSIVVTGANTNIGTSIRSNLAFIAMNVSQSLMVSNQELNAVGTSYLLTPLNAQDPKITVYYIDGHQTLSAVIPAETTTRFWLLDLTWVPPVSTWPKTQDLLKQNTVWSLDSGAPRYNLTLGRKSPEGPLIKVFMATYYPTFSVSVPASAWIDRNVVSFDIPSPSETTMPIIAGVSLVALIVASLWDWRLTGTLRARKKKR
jgi:hypothetical protein